MVAFSEVRDGAEMLVLDYIVHHASPELMNMMRFKYEPKRFDYPRHADDLANFAQFIEHGSSAIGREVVSAHVEGEPNGAITFYLCRLPGHIAAGCRARVVHNDETLAEGNGVSIILALTEKRSATRKKRNKKKKDSRGKNAAASTARDGERVMDDSCGFVLATSDGARSTDGMRGFVLAATDSSGADQGY
uniref:Uncharacterized protein n=1 Tax=Peronospora matthiolae TaxID=2874970 RepID=A0AAV1UDC8_9STRA